MAKLYVRCCEANKGEYGDNIYFDNKDCSFRYAVNNDVFTYCPWCGILLDLNLEMTRSEYIKML
jgi:hypothetical protein